MSIVSDPQGAAFGLTLKERFLRHYGGSNG